MNIIESIKRGLDKIKGVTKSDTYYIYSKHHDLVGIIGDVNLEHLQESKIIKGSWEKRNDLDVYLISKGGKFGHRFNEGGELSIMFEEGHVIVKIAD